MDNNLSILFNKAVFYIKNSDKIQLSNSSKLDFYKYYKQSTIGNINTTQPSMIHFNEYSKWKSWKSVENTNKVKYMTFEFNTIQPPKNDNPDTNRVDVLCDDNGEIIGIRKDIHTLNKYNFDLRIFEERYNMIEITSGRIGLLQAR